MSESGDAQTGQGSRRGQTSPRFILGFMPSVTFVGILSELLHSGVLQQMTDSFGTSESQGGLLVGSYALASAVFVIPLVSATLPVNRRKLLLALLAGFAASNFVVAIAEAHWLAITFRVPGRTPASRIWSIESTLPVESAGRCSFSASVP